MQKRKLVVGLLAHVDAGKTTLSEGMLYAGGAVRQLGRVDHQDAFLDQDVQERERGITIFSKQARMQWKDTDITLMDTPGHVDFSGEMERVLGVLDCAVLLISGADGVQGHTLTLWRLLKEYQVPVFLFVNKMDQPGTDREALLKNLKEELSENCLAFDDRDFMEQMAMCSEEALSQFLSYGEISKAIITKLIAKRQAFPCVFGSALKMQGVDTLLNMISLYGPKQPVSPDFGARVYKIARDPQGVRLTYLKITGGTLKVKDLMTNAQPGENREDETVWAEKVNQIRLYSGSKFTPAAGVESGEVCAVTGLNYTKAGQGLGRENGGPTPVMEPVFTYQVLLPQGYDVYAVLRNLRQLEEEEPLLRVVWHEQVREIHVQLMGEVQLEILRRLLRDRFMMTVEFSPGSILYKETIEDAVEGVGHYEPLRHYAEVHLLLEKGKRGSGMQFGTACSEDELDRNWQRLILTHLQEKQYTGVLTDSPLTDMKITLLSGRAHLKHTEGGDFRQATYRAVRQGLMQAKNVLLEPWYAVRLEVPRENVGRAMTDLQQMGGDFDPPEEHGNFVLLKGRAPVEKLRSYAGEVTGYTRGKGRLHCTFSGYEPCKNQEKAAAEIGYQPLRDVENPADSVFCAHGAGFVVPWNEVPSYMHLPFQKDRVSQKSEEEDNVVRRTAAYRGTEEEDRELMAIFEKTYGPVRTRTAFAPVKKEAAPAVPQDILPKPEYLLVDGYNILFAWPELKEAARHNLEHGRQMLMDILCNYRGIKNTEVILVFDAYKIQGNPGSIEKYKNIYVAYTKEAETADSYIEKATYEISKRRHVRVATSDGAEQMIILGNGAYRVSAEEFHREVEQAHVEIERILQEYNRYKPSDTVKNAMQDAFKKKHGKN